jgi:hypothetical protein
LRLRPQPPQALKSSSPGVARGIAADPQSSALTCSDPIPITALETSQLLQLERETARGFQASTSRPMMPKQGSCAASLPAQRSRPKTAAASTTRAQAAARRPFSQQGLGQNGAQERIVIPQEQRKQNQRLKATPD